MFKIEKTGTFVPISNPDVSVSSPNIKWPGFLFTFSALLYFIVSTTEPRHSYLPHKHSRTELYPALDVLLTEKSSLYKTTSKFIFFLAFYVCLLFSHLSQNSSPP